MEATSKQKEGHGLIGLRAIWAAGDNRAPGTSGTGLSIREARQPGPGSPPPPNEEARQPGPGSGLPD
jgi:hypothetical protein